MYCNTIFVKLDAKFNGLEYDAQEECAQVEEYRESIQPPGGDARMASWKELEMQIKDIKRASLEDVDLSME